jgi:hypothetical protein
MGRQISKTDPFSDKLVKLIPTEIVGAYMVLAGILGFGPASPAPASAAGQDIPAGPVKDAELQVILIQVVFFMLLVATPLYLRIISKVGPVLQIVATTISYVVWVYTLGGPFTERVWNIYNPLVAPVVLVLWTIFLPFFVPRDPIPQP